MNPESFEQTPVLLIVGRQNEGFPKKATPELAMLDLTLRITKQKDEKLITTRLSIAQ